MSYIIEPRDRIEIFLNQEGTISIKQDNPYGDDAVVTVHPEDVPKFLKYLEAVHQQALAPDPQHGADAE